MSKFNLIVSDPAWSFSDRLQQSSVKRGAASQYDVLSNKDIINLDVKSIVADDAILVLWVPGSLLQEGLDTLKNWGFKQKQVFVWVKNKKEPFKSIKKSIRKHFKEKDLASILKEIDEFNLNNTLSFFMGHLFRQTHEIALVGTRGKPYSKLANNSQRSVCFDFNRKHSEKPEELQDRLDIMFPSNSAFKKLEMFARRKRNGWVCVGNEISLKEDIRDSIERLKTQS